MAITLHPLAEHFSGVADAYERGRPEYPPAVVGALAAELQLGPGAPVLDLAAGTGKLTRALLEQGFDVVAVEPQAELRDILAAAVGAGRVRDGLAEAIPLENSSVAAVTVADAFHWFHAPAALSEIARVLRRRGSLAILSTAPDWRGASWAHDVGALLSGLRPEHPNFDGPAWQDALRASGAFGEPREVRMAVTQPARPERIVDYVASMSWIAAMPESRRSEVLGQVDAIVDAGDTPAELALRVVIGLASVI